MKNTTAADESSGKETMTEVSHLEDKYGKELAIVKDLGVGPTMAARVVDKMLYTIGRGKLHIADISNPADPKIVGKIDGLGNTRQLVVSDGIAYVTSREDSVFIVDVGNSQAPELLCHYDAIEVATGVDVSGNVLFVACRPHGVELVDVSNPRKPLHLSTARTGEAQSVAVRNGYAYVGVWGTSELVVVDVRNPREPEITAKCPLDGFGDGVAVRGKYVYAATGHHSRARKTWRPKEGDPGYGCGHGLEIFDISNPAEPTFVSRIKSPPFYGIRYDMWGVKVAGDHAFVADTHNGIFVVNIKNPKRPFFVAHKQLPYVESQKLPAFVGGLALTKDYIYVADGWTDLHVVAAPDLAEPCKLEPDKPPVIPPFRSKSDKRFRIYHPGDQVRAVDFMGDTAVVAAGSDGIHVVQLWPEIKRLNQYETEGFAMEVKVFGEQVYVAEERGGLSIWRRSGTGALTFQSRYEPRGPIVRDVTVPPPGKYALLKLGEFILDIVDVSNPVEPKRAFCDNKSNEKHGRLYHIGEDLIEDRYVCILWATGGLGWYDLYGGTGHEFTVDKYAHRLGDNGTVPLRDKRLVIYGGGFLLIDREEHRPPTEMKIHSVDKCRLNGKPRLYGNKLYVSNRAMGDISIVDVSDVTQPKLLEHFNVPGNPGKIVLHNGILVIPNGYEGLWVDDKNRE